MSLNLAPEVETILEQKAANEGISVETLIRRTFAPQSLTTTETQASGQTRVPIDNFVLSFLKARVQEAEDATNEDITIADAEYKRWQQDMDETRRTNGERLLFPDATRP